MADVEDEPGEQDNPYVKPLAKGFRLLSGNEWELAARWRSDVTNTVAGYSNPYFTKVNSASGATADSSNASATGLVAWYANNSGSSTHEVKGRDANSMGLYDMNGNVFEWCFDAIGSNRMNRGGCWADSAGTGYLQVGKAGGGLLTSTESFAIGFRFARTN